MKNLVAILTVLCSSIVCMAQLQRIPLAAKDAYVNNKVDDDLNYLIDDNHLTSYKAYNPIIKPVRVTFMLPSGCAPMQLKYFVNNGATFTVKFYYVRRLDNKEVLFFTYTGGSWEPFWHSFDIAGADISTKLIIESEGAGAFPDDIQLWGVYTADVSPLPEVKHYKVKEVIGVVAHPWDINFTEEASTKGARRLQSWRDLGVGNARIYVDAHMITDGNSRYHFDTWNLPKNMQRLKELGVSVQYCYQNQAPDVKASWPVSSHLNFFYPFNNDVDRLRPSSYFNIAGDAAAITKNNLSLRYYKNFEPGNEWGAWWAGYNGFMSGGQQAAMLTAVYDSIKKVDPGIQVTNPGIAWDRPDPFFEMVDYANQFNGGRIPLDYYSYHCYSSAGGQYSASKGGIPSEYIMYDKAEKMVYFSVKYGGGKPVVIGETGWDVDQNSPINAPAFDSYTAEQTRAYWSIRMLLKMIQAGVWQVQWYRYTQDYYPGDPRGGNYASDHSGEQFATMALTRQVDDSVHIVLTTVGSFISQFVKAFGDYTYASMVRDDSVQVMKLTDGIHEAYAIWSVEKMFLSDVVGSRPQFTEIRGNVTVNVGGKKYTFTEDSSNVMKAENFYGGLVQYSSKPVFIIAENVQAPLPVKLISFTAQKISKAVILKWIVQDAVKVEVERSLDGRTWTNLGEGLFNKLVDQHPGNGFNYYRLKMMDADSSFSYSYILSVFIGKKYLRVEVVNTLGQVVMAAQSDDVDLFVEEFKRSDLRPGLYVLRFSDEKNSFTKKVAK